MCTVHPDFDARDIIRAVRYGSISDVEYRGRRDVLLKVLGAWAESHHLHQCEWQAWKRARGIEDPTWCPLTYKRFMSMASDMNLSALEDAAAAARRGDRYIRVRKAVVRCDEGVSEDPEE